MFSTRLMIGLFTTKFIAICSFTLWPGKVAQISLANLVCAAAAIKFLLLQWYQDISRDAKRCDRCDQCSCKDFPTGVKILVENVMKGGVNKCQVFVTTAGNQKCLCL